MVDSFRARSARPAASPSHVRSTFADAIAYVDRPPIGSSGSHQRRAFALRARLSGVDSFCARSARPSASSSQVRSTFLDAIVSRIGHQLVRRDGLPQLHRSVTRHAPRPCVKANNCFCPAGVRISDSHIVTAGPNPVSSVIHVRPPSIDTITPRSVPRYSRC
jgi:hypothetical protein